MTNSPADTRQDFKTVTFTAPAGTELCAVYLEAFAERSEIKWWLGDIEHTGIIREAGWRDGNKIAFALDVTSRRTYTLAQLERELSAP